MTHSFTDMIKKTAAVISAAAITAFTALPVSAEQPEQPENDPAYYVQVSDPPHVVFLGDSITAGYGLDGYSPDDLYHCDSYANILSRTFGETLPEKAGFTAVNKAKDGTTSEGMLNKLRSGDLDEDLGSADAVIMSIGGNDLLDTFLELFGKDDGVSGTVSRVLSLSRDLDEKLKGFEKNLPLIANELHMRADGAKIFVQTLYNPMESTAISKLNEMSDEKIDKLNSIIRDCSRDGTMYTVVDIAGPFEGRSEELTNIGKYDIHPNAEGHAEIAKLMLTAVESTEYSYYDVEAALRAKIEELEASMSEQDEKISQLTAELEKTELERLRAENKSRSISIALICTGAVLLLTAISWLTVGLIGRKKKNSR
ncbi:MAG: SGNH/GDSL hydrolase family protein [Ruminococcus sp.]|nr:SGNH/GDSL hydrolase family protein [Ruminococcus sp.]